MLPAGTTEVLEILSMAILMVRIVEGAPLALYKEVWNLYKMIDANQVSSLSTSCRRSCRSSAWFWHQRLGMYSLLSWCLERSSLTECVSGQSSMTDEQVPLAKAHEWEGYWRIINSAGSSTAWQGMAPQAKIAFQDLGSGTSGNILVPANLARDYFPFAYSRWTLLSKNIELSAIKTMNFLRVTEQDYSF